MSTSMPMSTASAASQPRTTGAPRVAIVCRLDAALGKAAAAFIEQLGLDPVVVEAAPSQGQSQTIDRLDGVRGADYAIVMLPANDLGAPSGGSGARSDVLLEAGFLFGAVGRRRVCFLLDGQPSLGPQLDAVVVRHVMDDAGLWRLLLAREMKQAGLAVDMNRAL